MFRGRPDSIGRHRRTLVTGRPDEPPYCIDARMQLSHGYGSRFVLTSVFYAVSVNVSPESADHRDESPESPVVSVPFWAARMLGR